MKKFMALYTGTPEGMAAWNKLSDDERRSREQAAMKAWGEWVDAHRGAIIDGGAPLGKTKRITSQGVADSRNNVAAYVVVEADSHEAAAKLFLNHPHFTLFPGDGVEVMECLPLPR